MYDLKDMSNLTKQVNKYLKTKIKLNLVHIINLVSL
jgi:hypothetical protein